MRSPDLTLIGTSARDFVANPRWQGGSRFHVDCERFARSQNGVIQTPYLNDAQRY
jgi:hypothetical protein